MQAVLWFGQCYHLCKAASPLMLLAILTDLRTMDLFWSVRFPWAKKTSAWLQWACKESLRSWSFRLILSCLTLPKTRCAAQSCVLTYPFLSDPSKDSLCSTIMCSDLSFPVWPFRRLTVQHNHVTCALTGRYKPPIQWKTSGSKNTYYRGYIKHHCFFLPHGLGTRVVLLSDNSLKCTLRCGIFMETT